MTSSYTAVDVIENKVLYLDGASRKDLAITIASSSQMVHA